MYVQIKHKTHGIASQQCQLPQKCQERQHKNLMYQDRLYTQS